MCSRKDAHSLRRVLERMFIFLGVSKEDGLVIPLSILREEGHSLGHVQGGWSFLRACPRKNGHFLNLIFFSKNIMIEI